MSAPPFFFKSVVVANAFGVGCIIGNLWREKKQESECKVN